MPHRKRLSQQEWNWIVIAIFAVTAVVLIIWALVDLSTTTVTIATGTAAIEVVFGTAEFFLARSRRRNRGLAS
jgi:hypothetical protein